MTITVTHFDEVPTEAQQPSPPAPQGGRDGNGRFAPGTQIGAATRWRLGQSGNRAGRKSYGAYVSEWINVMAEWTEDKLQAIIDNPHKEPAVKRTAARLVLSAASNAKTAGEDFDRCCDRTSGKPKAAVDVTQRAEVVKLYAPGPMEEVLGPRVIGPTDEV